MEPTRFERLLAPHHDAALGFARCLCGSHSDGDDLFQTALIQAYRHLDGLRHDGAFRSWLYRIIVNAHRNSVRRPFWKRLVPLGDHDAAAGGGPGDQHDGVERVRRALAALPLEQREALVLFEIVGMTVEEIARVQDTSVSSVKSRLARGRDRLRERYLGRLGAARLAALPEPAPAEGGAL